MTEKKKHLVWPDLAFMEFLTAIALTIILIVWGLLANAPLLEIASPTRSENPSKAPWYFVGLQELLVYFDPWIAGVMIPAIIILCLMVIPYIDRDPHGSGEYTFSLRKLAIINFIFGFLMWLILIFIGYFLRGPNWQLYLPWESWEKVKELEENLWSLNPEIGLISLIIYFGLGMMMPKLIKKDFYKKCGFVRYVIIMLSILLMYFVPVKIFLRLVFNIKYVLVTPWFNI
ncbi:MAG: hypothetical protein HZB30_12185 [Nitrospirae bacterium]|nr:hypothetical protein [Nitrospirota bacterium]